MVETARKMKIVISAVQFILVMASGPVTEERNKFVLPWCFIGSLLHVKAFMVLGGGSISDCCSSTAVLLSGPGRVKTHVFSVETLQVF